MRVRESLLRDALRLVIWHPFRWLVAALPWRLGWRCLEILGDLHWRLSPGKRRMLADNCRRLAPDLDEAALRREGLRYLRVHYLNQLIIFLIPRLDRAALDELVEWEGLEHLDAALARDDAAGRGVVLAHPHFGPVHLPLLALARRGYPLKQIGMPSAEGLSWVGRNVAYRLRLRLEAGIPAEIIHANKDLRAVFRHLRAGGAVMLTADGSGDDQEYGRHIPLDFHGHVLRFPLGAASLALRTGATLLPLFLRPGETKPWRVVVEPALVAPQGEATSGRDPAMAMARAWVQRYKPYARRWPGCMHFLDRYAPGLFIVDEAPLPAATSR